MNDLSKLTAALEAVLAALSPKTTMGQKGRSSGKKRNPAYKKKAAKPDTTALAIAAFEAKGFTDVQPKVNVLTYNGWITKGRKVKVGEKGTKVGPFTLFHVSQTEGLAEAAAQAELKAQNQAILDAEYGPSVVRA